MHWLPLICALADPSAGGQDSVPPAPDADGQEAAAVVLNDVVVVGRRGAALAPAEREWDADDIDVLGAYDIREVLARLGETLGLEQPPVVLVNGRRAVDVRNFYGFPPDALVRVEALPSQAAAMYGGDPSRRVLNIVLQPEFRSRDVLATGSRPTAGGSSSLSADARQSEIQEMNTRQFGVQLSRVTALHADEREDYSRDHPGQDGTTLRPAQDVAGANIALTGPIGDWSAAANATFQAQDTLFASMVGGAPVETTQESRTLSLNGGVSGQALGWSVRLGLDGMVDQTEQGGLAELKADSASVSANISADRMLATLPAGPLLATVSGVYSGSRVVSEVSGLKNTMTSQFADLSGSLSAPLLQAAPGEGEGAGLGDLSLSIGGRLRVLDDTDADGGGVNLGLSWAPVRVLRLSGQWSGATDGPSRQQRLAPLLYGPPRTVYDFQTGESVEILPLTGGNPDLRPQKTDSLSVSASVGPFGPWGLQANLGFRRDVSTDSIGALPALTPATEAAFPDRFIRDGAGRLTGVDQRPLNLDSVRVEAVSSGLALNIPLRGGAAPGARVGSLQVGLSHTWQTANVLVISDALPALDRLAGDGGGMPRHQVNLRLDGRYRNWGLNALANWRSATRIRRDLGQDGPGDLMLEPFVTISLRLNYLLELPVAVSEAGGSRRDTGLRLGLEVDNLFDARPEARIGGAVAPGYGRDDQDPLGRVIRLTLSRRF